MTYKLNGFNVQHSNIYSDYIYSDQLQFWYQIQAISLMIN